MVDRVVETEGPLYFDLLVERIARAHGFQRATAWLNRRLATASSRSPRTTAASSFGRDHLVEMLLKLGQRNP